MDTDLPKYSNEKEYFRAFAEHLRQSLRDRYEKLPDGQKLNLEFITDEFAERVLRGVIEEQKRQRFIRKLLRPGFFAKGLGLFAVPAGFVVVLALLSPAWVTLTWSLPVVVAALFAIPLLRQIPLALQQAYKIDDVDPQSAESWMQGIVDVAIDQQRVFQKQYRLLDHLSDWLGIFLLPYLLPLAVMDFVGRRYTGYLKVLRYLPITLDLVWDILFLVFSFVVAQRGFPYAGLFLGATVGLWYIQSLFTSFKTVGIGKYRTTNWLTLQRDSFSVRPYFRHAAAAVISFAACYHAISLIDSQAFSRQLTVFDAVYFSVVTAATVGYGDITPVSTAAKFVCLLEIICSFVITVFVIATVVAAWQSAHLNREGERKSESDVPQAEPKPDLQEAPQQ